jgi:hypothetical protein
MVSVYRTAKDYEMSEEDARALQVKMTKVNTLQPLCLAVLRIRDVYPGSRILIFTHPGSRIQKPQLKGGVKKIFLSNLFL